ncbi:MAG: hypothetical protein RL266_625 [Bacteroidota bacterium]
MLDAFIGRKPPSMKHLFTISLLLISTFASAQTACDSLDFVSIKYSPFTDSLIIVHVQNNNANEIFDYPGFVLLDDNGDTLALETVNYFGIGSESVHSLEVRQGVHDPLDNFAGTLKLYSSFYNTFECEWDMDRSLCADSPCDSLVIGFQNWGGALVLGDFAWSVFDSTGTVLESGVLTMTTDDQYWFHGLCLSPGMYSYTLQALGEPSGGGPVLTASSSTSYASPSLSTYLEWFSDPSATLQIPFFEHCIDPAAPSGIRELKKESVQIVRNGSLVSVVSLETMQQIDLYASDGRSIATYSPNSSQFPLPTEIPIGMYIIRVQTGKGWTVLKVVL